MNSESHILQSWQQNAAAWTDTVRREQIESRTLVTNRAIVDAVMADQPRSVLDVGCGEGWLTRTLASGGIQALGVDAVPSLIEQAQQAGGADYTVSSYQDIVHGSLSSEIPFDVVVANFSLFGEGSVERLVRHVPQLLRPGGRFVVQTLHPLVATGDQPYRDGWRDGSWQGFDEKFVNPAPWYFRTLASWVQLITNNGFALKAIKEPTHPRTQQPASVIFVSTSLPTLNH